MCLVLLVEKLRCSPHAAMAERTRRNMNFFLEHLLLFLFRYFHTPSANCPSSVAQAAPKASHMQPQQLWADLSTQLSP